MKPETQGKIKFGIWGLISGAIITMIVGFAWGGWATQGTSEAMASDAVVASQSAICVAQFMKDSDQEANLKEFKELNSWKKDDFIKKGGWDRMPGQDKADYGVADACADGIELLVKDNDA